MTEEERETGVVCPACDGLGVVPRTDAVQTVVVDDCDVCQGRAWLTMNEWREAKLAGKLPKP